MYKYRIRIQKVMDLVDACASARTYYTSEYAQAEDIRLEDWQWLLGKMEEDYPELYKPMVSAIGGVFGGTPRSCGQRRLIMKELAYRFSTRFVQELCFGILLWELEFQNYALLKELIEWSPMTPYQILQKEGPCTVTDLLHHSRLSITELTEEIDNLFAKGLIEAVHRGPLVPMIRVKQ